MNKGWLTKHKRNEENEIKRDKKEKFDWKEFWINYLSFVVPYILLLLVIVFIISIVMFLLYRFFVVPRNIENDLSMISYWIAAGNH